MYKQELNKTSQVKRHVIDDNETLEGRERRLAGKKKLNFEVIFWFTGTFYDLLTVQIQ